VFIKGGGGPSDTTAVILTLWRRNFLLNFSTTCIKKMNKTETKKGIIMK
jgi:hypothetical protein